MVRRMLREVLVGREDPEGFFALCLSALGHRETRSQFPSYIQPLSAAYGSLHGCLTSIYTEYFSQVRPAPGALRGFSTTQTDASIIATSRVLPPHPQQLDVPRVLLTLLTSLEAISLTVPRGTCDASSVTRLFEREN